MRILKVLLLAIFVSACTVQVGGYEDNQTVDSGTAEQQEELRDAARAIAKLFDEGQYSESWALVGPVLQAQTNQEAWARHLTAFRKPFGQPGKRTIIGVGFTTEIDGAPPGEYGIISVETDFSNANDVEEKFVFERASGEWRLVGYWLSKNLTIGGQVGA